MKRIFNPIHILAFVLMISLTACFDERDEGYDMVGPVATIPVFTISNTLPLASEEITVNIRYYSEQIQVIQIRFIETISAGTAAVVTTKDITDFNIENSYEDTFAYMVPAVPAGTVVTLTIEIETVNGLVNRRSGSIKVI